MNCSTGFDFRNKIVGAVGISGPAAGSALSLEKLSDRSSRLRRYYPTGRKSNYKDGIWFLYQRLMKSVTLTQSDCRHGTLTKAIAAGALPSIIDSTLSELIVLGLLRQGVRTFFAVFGHGSTEIGEVLRVYQESGLVNVLGVRNEIEASHAATALHWVSGEPAAVITSIGPGTMQALAASLVPASDGIGVWYLMGDETSVDEGYNMHRAKHVQGLFHQNGVHMGGAYTLHTPLHSTACGAA